MNSLIIKSMRFFRDYLISVFVITFVMFDLWYLRWQYALVAFVVMAVASSYAYIKVLGWVIKTIKNQHVVEVKEKPVSFVARTKTRNVTGSKMGKPVEWVVDSLFGE